MFLTLNNGANQPHERTRARRDPKDTVRHPHKTGGLTSTLGKQLPGVQLRTTGPPPCFVPKVKGEKIAEVRCAFSAPRFRTCSEFSSLGLMAYVCP